MYSIIFSGKFETEDKNAFISGLEELAKNTNTKIQGNFQIHQFIDFEELPDSDVEILDANAETENNTNSDVSSGN